MNVEGGAAIPIHITTNAPVGAPVLPVYLYTQATLGNRRIDGGPITSVYVVSDAELANGTFKLQGNLTAIPVIDYTSLDTSIPDIHPIPVYITNPTPPSPPVIPWYLSGGVNLINCVAAYQSKGAVDYATSKTNLANPGTHDLTDGSIPAFDINGWLFNGSTNYLISDISSVEIGRGNGTFIIYIKYVSGAQYIFGASYWPGSGLHGVDIILNGGAIALTVSYNDDAVSSVSGITTGSTNIIGVSGPDIYNNGSYYGSFSTPNWQLNQDSNDIAIGALAGLYDPDPLTYYFGMRAYVYAVSFYDIMLTAAQVAAITTAMQSL